MSDSSGSPRGTLASFSCESRVAGVIAIPTSKSIAQRAVVAALLARGTTRIEGLPPSDDVLHAIRSARAAGAAFPSASRPDDLLETALVGRRGFGQLTGAPLMRSRDGVTEGARPWCTLPVGESGTAARLFTAAVALARPAGSGAEVVPSGSLVRRTSPALFEALRRAGVGVERSHQDQTGSWPVLLTAAAPPDIIDLAGPGSSQEVSALLMALAAHSEQHQLRVIGPIPSRGYVDITIDVLTRFGAFVRSSPLGSDDASNAGETFIVQGPLVAPEAGFVVEPDASSAAVALAASALSGGGEVRVEGLGLHSRQPDVAIVRALAEFGCDTTASGQESLVCSGEPTRGASIDCSLIPDAAPVLAAVGAFVALRGFGRTKLTGLETLPGKESSRIEVLAAGLRAVGLSVDHDDRSLTIHQSTTEPAPRRQPIVLDACGDHRMAFAFALLSLCIDEVWVSGARSVAKSWPDFWSSLTRSGAILRPDSKAPHHP
ncbi:3-phosphoshikimate 1-carboxyvinyltransferase [Planctomycetes bacterium Poly30]|uniref:3-phosphoshikimate 1-carboxyvinyltransferase n=1 Tax=Saltatorellus ferox TaxID=2528018 RepID=A0A518ETJ0_9BACT|nr:3-phosphoshikimate 1-carboxyvinyltransferase [Planctomycetes bacterium Poly30]